MRVQRAAEAPPRGNLSWDERWAGADMGLIACWEVGREWRAGGRAEAALAAAGELPELPWKGSGIGGPKATRKWGTLYYLAMWQGLRGQDLDVTLDADVSHTCARTGLTVTFTGDRRRWAGAAG